MRATGSPLGGPLVATGDLSMCLVCVWPALVSLSYQQSVYNECHVFFSIDRSVVCMSLTTYVLLTQRTCQAVCVSVGVNDRGGSDWPPNYCGGDGGRHMRPEVNSRVVGQEGWVGRRGEQKRRGRASAKGMGRWKSVRGLIGTLHPPKFV